MRHPQPITEVNLLGLSYQVEFVDEISPLEDVDGLISPDKRTIYISSSLPTDEAFEVLIHEVIHGILMRIGRHQEASDELLVQGLAIGISQVLNEFEQTNNQ